MLLHSEQGDSDECMYRATYALTHDPEWLKLARDGDASDDALWLSRLAERGIIAYAQHVTQQAYAPPCGRDFWLWFRRHTHEIEPGEIGMIVTLWGHALYHAVAVLLDTGSGAVTVSDSCAPGLQVFAWPDFLDSPYARAYRIEMLMGMHDPPDQERQAAPQE